MHHRQITFPAAAVLETWFALLATGEQKALVLKADYLNLVTNPGQHVAFPDIDVADRVSGLY